MPTLVTREIRRPGLARSTKILIAVLLSVIIHCLLLLLLAWALPHWPRARLPGRSGPFRLTITKSTPAPQADQAAASGGSTPPPYIPTLDEQQADKPPDQPSFISDKDTHAASEQPANGDKPLPSQQGKEIPDFQFDTRPFRLDKVASSAASAAPASPTDSKAPDKQKDQHTKTKTSAPDSKSKPAVRPEATPSPAGDLATLKPVASPTPEEFPGATPDNSETPPPPEAQPMARQPITLPATPNSKTSIGLPKRPGYQPETIQTKMAGSINNRGRAAVSAIGTPMGRYDKLVSDAVGMRWYYYVQQRADLISVGTVKIHFVVNSSGHVGGIKIVSGNANGVLADISIAAISEAEIPPIPDDVAATLDGNQLEVDYDFSEY